ncbi:MAG: purine-binding chemotaxis protein CheW [Spirochaetes bacterium]|nr:purine-binding chemotaxis protein CheW [Spirochaetota bacterium]
MERTVDSAESTPYLSFKLDGEVFALPIARVREVLEWPRLTRLPKTPPFMVGVINLRGGVVPVVDLRRKFDLPAREATVDSSIIIIEASHGGKAFVIGALVDAVKAVIRLGAEAVEKAPHVGMRLSGAFLRGIGRCGGEFVILLEPERLFSLEEMQVWEDSPAPVVA